jgi:sn-glycerol 3-phosphate transport system permease protein
VTAPLVPAVIPAGRDAGSTPASRRRFWAWPRAAPRVAKAASAPHKRAIFNNRLLPYALLLPQIAITLVFFYWPASQALWQSFLLQDAFGLSTDFVWFENYRYLFSQPEYYHTMVNTLVFSASVAVLSLSFALLLAVMADKQLRAGGAYRTLLIWPYAVAPAVAGVLWLFMFQPSLGVLAQGLRAMGFEWNPLLNGTHAMILVILASAWKQISYNFLFFLAGLAAIPKSVIEAAAIDGARPARRFWTIVFPLLSPTTFFLLVVNIVYAFFDTFGIIDTMTGGGPGKATQTLVYKVYSDGRLGGDLGGSAAQSVILMIIVIALTAIQFRYVERRVTY